MVDFTVDIPSFENFLAEDAKAISDANHHTKNGDGDGTDLKPVVSDKGSTTPEVIEKSNNAAPGDGKGDDLQKPPVS
ncbi:hypothetical protein [Xanthomonas phage BUDD]|nr:hypothetical protein [Xanthomonas phage BUDD]